MIPRGLTRYRCVRRQLQRWDLVRRTSERRLLWRAAVVEGGFECGWARRLLIFRGGDEGTAYVRCQNERATGEWAQWVPGC